MSENMEFFEYVRKNRRRSMWHKFVRVMACIVVFCTTYALILPAITMESQTWCGYEEHIHDETCLNQLDTVVDAQLECELGALGVHAHTDSCRDSSGVLICGYADYVIHTHSEVCTDASGNLICMLPEVTAHIHSDACYSIPEAEVHDHSEACYEVTRGAQTCTLEEKAGHAHEKACYGSEGTLVCGQEEHAAYAHSDTCYTVETVTICGMESHPHTDACFTPKTLNCTEEEHSHSAACYAEPALTCGTEIHDHSEGCYTDGELTCGREVHAHGSGCYAEAELICGKSVHAHGDGCYTAPVQICGLDSHPHTDDCYSEVKTLICEKVETEGHTHSDACYEYPLICTLAEEEGHQHTDDCFERIETLICDEDTTTAALEPVLSCGREEICVHIHDDSCLDDAGNRVCGLLQIQEHVHTEACMTQAQEQPLVCEQEENEEHQHSEMCYGTWGYGCGMEEHAHILACFSDPEADTENAEVWNQMFANVELTGSFADDLAAIAKTQLGYAESGKNYQVLEDGITMKGYTRYGAWAGTPYADWNALFVAFCMDYAKVPEEVFPTASTAAQWVEALSDSYYDLYYAADSGYLPKTGDVAFLHVPESENETEEEKKIPNFMGIVLECTDTELTIAAGDSNNMVEKQRISLSDPSLLGYGEVFAMPALTETLEEDPYDLGAVVTVNCLNAQNQSTETYAGLEPFELRISFYMEMAADQTYTLTLAENFAAESVDKLWGDCPYTYDSATRTITFSPTNSQPYGGELSVKGKIASYTADTSVNVAPVENNSKTVTITKNPQQLSYTDSNGQFTVQVDLLDPSSPNSIYTKVKGIQLTPVQPNETLYQAMTNGESGTLGNDRVYERQMFTVQLVDENNEVVTGLDLSSRNITLTVTGMDSLKGVGDADTVTHAFYKIGNAVNEMTSVQENAYVYEISGSALTDNAFILDFVSTNPKELAEGTYGDARFAYNDMRDAFIHDPTYAEFYNADSPLGTAGSFHLVGFGDVYTNAHTNGNILAYNLYAYNNFGSNTKDGYEDFRELHYVQNYKFINSTSSARGNDILVIGSNHAVDVINGDEFVVNDSKIGRPKNLIQDDDSNSAPFIDLHRVESEIRAISANIGSYDTIESREYLDEHQKAPEEFIIANVQNSSGKYGPEYGKNEDPDFKKNHESDDPYLEILDKDNIGVWNATPRQIQALADIGRGLDMKGFASNGSGAIIVNVDMSQWPDEWPADKVLELPEARVYVDGKAESVSETLDFSAGKVIWNFTNADGKQIKTNIMTGMVVAPGATVTISQNLNGTVVAENIDVRAESHRTDFVGKIYKNEFLTSAHIHVHKVDKENYGHLLAGAEFKIYEYTANGYVEASVKVTDADSSQQTGQAIGVTGTNGVILFDELKYNTVYKLVETKAPAGYQLDSTERYLYFEKTGEGVAQGPKPSDFNSLNFINSSADGDCVHYHFTNTEQDVEKTSISVKKSWDLGSNGPAEVPVDLVYFHVYQKATTVTVEGETPAVTESWYGMYPVTKGNSWQTTIVNLPRTSADGNTTYTYSVREVSVPGFITTYSTNNADGVESSSDQIVITNTINPSIDYVDLRVHKAWIDSSGAPITDHGFAEIGFTLYQVSSSNENGTNHSVPVVLGHYTLTAKNGWLWEINNLISVDVVNGEDIYYFYYVEEDPIDGYTPTYRGDLITDSTVAPAADQLVLGKEKLTITNKKDPTTSISLEKQWYDEHTDADGNPVVITAPVDSITVQLQRMTRFMNDWENYGEPITVTKDQNWKYTVTELPMYDSVINADGTRNPYYYRFVETEVDGFDVAYTIVHPQNPGYAVNEEIDGIGNGGKIVISNTKRETTSLNIQKVWENPAGGPLTDIDVASITVRVYRQLGDDATTKQEYKVVTITPDENKAWSCMVEDLPKTDANGVAYVYTVEEDAVAGYVTTYSTVEHDGVSVHQITNQARTGYTTIQVDKQWAMLNGTNTPPEGTTVTFDLIQRSAPENWEGTYLDTSTLEPVTVQYTVNGVTHSVEGYPGETVNLILHWEKLYDTDNIAYADPGAYLSWASGWKSLTSTVTNTTETGADFTASFTIFEDINESTDGKKYITISDNTGGNSRFTFVDLQLIPTARETVVGTYTIPNEENGDKWSFKKIGLPSSQEIGGVTFDYTYFVEEHTVPGFDTSYSPAGPVTGGTITITNSERDIYTDITVNKVWSLPEGSTTPESITYELHKVTSTVKDDDSAGAEMVDVSFVIKDRSGNVWNHTKLAEATKSYPKGTNLQLSIVSNYYQNQDMSWCTATVNGVTYSNGAGVTIVNGHPGYIFNIILTDDMTITGFVDTGDLLSAWTPDVMVNSSVVSDEVAATVVLNTSNNWTNSHADIPVEGVLEDGTTVYYTYYVKETQVNDVDISESGYISTTSKGEDGNISITNRSDDSKTTVSVSKVWVEQEGVNAADIIHDDVEVKIYRKVGETKDENFEETLTLSASEDIPWFGSKEGLPIVDADGNLYTYYIEEAEVEGYTSTVAVNETTDGSFEFTLTNTAKDYTWTSLTVDKAWKYPNGNTYTPTEDDQVTLTLKKIASKIGTSDQPSEDTSETRVSITLNDSTAITEYFVGQKINLFVVWTRDTNNQTMDVLLNGSYSFNRNYGSIYNEASTYTLHKIDENSMRFILPIELTEAMVGGVKIYCNDMAWGGTLSLSHALADETTTTTTVMDQMIINFPYTDESGNLIWSHTFDRLPLSDPEGTAYSYYVVEENGKMYNVTYGNVSEETAVTTGTITATNTVTSLEVKKVWVEADSSTTLDHDAVTVIVHRKTGDKVDETYAYQLTLSDGNEWVDSIDGLPVADADGNDYTYYVDEVAVSGYTSEVSANQATDGTYSFTITNTKTTTEEPEDTSLTVQKKWFKDGSETTKSSGEIQFDLYQVATPKMNGIATLEGDVIIELKINGEDGYSVLPFSACEKNTYSCPAGSVVSITLYNRYWMESWANPDTRPYPVLSYGGNQISNNAVITQIDNGLQFVYVFVANQSGTLTGNLHWNASANDWTTASISHVEGAGGGSDDDSGNETESTPTVSLYGDSPYTLSVANGWKKTFQSLPLESDDGRYAYTYYVVERDGAEYDVTYMYGQETSWDESYDINGSTVVGSKPVSSGTITIKNSIPNEGYELPETGGIGTTPYTLSGLAMLLCGAVLFLLKRRQMI